MNLLKSSILILFIGLALTAIIIGLNIWGTQNKIEYHYKSYPDSLITHFPERFGLTIVGVSQLPYQSRQALGLESVVLTIKENNATHVYIKEYVDNYDYDTIEANQLFKIEIDKKDYCLKSTINSEFSRYPMPSEIDISNFDSYKLIFYDFMIDTVTVTDKPMNKVENNWKHGYSRGIAESPTGEYKIWLMIW